MNNGVAALVVVVLVGGGLVLAGGTVSAQDDPGSESAVDLGVYGEPVRFTADEGVTMELSSGRRIVDTVEFRPSPAGGMVVIAEMSMRDYVAGVAEMPARWPLEALKAQAVAARTYAWYQATLETFERRGLGYDTCATTACQVFRGREVVETPVVGRRWQRAVDETAGEVLLHDGEPILARYFSTSGGRTRDNDEVFGDPYPYLQGIDDPDDATSPYHRWQARFTRAQFDELLGRGQTLGAATPVRDVEVVEESGSRPDRVVVTGRDGTTAEVTTGQLRDFLNELAPDRFPGQFPGRRSDGGALPTTVPSSRFEAEVTDDRVVLHGRGWGHGVGMGQYGAKGKAERGLDHTEILSTYYNGVTPTTTDRMPERVRVGLADDASEIALSADGRMRVTVAGQELTDRAFGTWRLRAADDGTTRVLAPGGYGAPLVVESTTATRTHPLPVEALSLETVVNKPTELVVEVVRDGEPVGRRPIGVVDAGRHRVTWDLGTDAGSLSPGTYEVTLLGVDEDGTSAGTPTSVTVEPVRAEGRPPPALPEAFAWQVAGSRVPVAGMALGLLVGLAGGVLLDRRRERAT